MGESAPALPPIPAGHRLLHIGLPKSGTTSLQGAAAARRRELVASGVLYPGTSVNHRLALSAAMDREATGSSRRVRTSDWTSVVRTLNRAPERALLSYELVCAASDSAARRIVDDLGPGRTHVVVTVRAQSVMLPSIWQQYVKTNLRLTFEEWARAVLGDEQDITVTPSFRRRHDLGAVCARWADIVGPERVNVVVLDPAQPELLPQVFEQMLGLPEGMLDPDHDGVAENRSLTFAEIELVRRVQQRTMKRRVSGRWRSELIMHGVVPALQARSPAPSDVGGVKVPEWADAVAREQARAAVATIRQIGVGVVGDLEVLTAPGKTVTEAAAKVLPKAISLDAVAAAVAAVADLTPPAGLMRPARAAEATGRESLRVRESLVASRGRRWIARHENVLRGMHEGESRVKAAPQRDPDAVGITVAAAMVAGVISRAMGRGDYFAQRPGRSASLGDAVRWAWVRWRRGHLGRILKGLGPGI